VNTIHRPNARLTAGFYHQDDLRPFSNQLAAYTLYAQLFIELRFQSRSLRAMGRALENNTRLRLGRAAAQLELQSIYDHIAFGLRMPRLPVRLPLRKRPYKRGAAVTYRNGRHEIRLYAFHGPEKKARHNWQPMDIGISRPPLMCEVLLHEIAHIHQGFFTGQWDHEEGFVQSYLVIEEIMHGFGFAPLLPERLRLCGCPVNSVGARLQGTKRPQVIDDVKITEDEQAS
jgi:hypothetical protein